MADIWNDEEMDAKRKELAEQFVRRRLSLVESMGKIMGTPDGRLVMRWILERADAFGAQYCEDHGEASFREGRKWVAMEILKVCQRAGVAARLLDSEENNG